MSISKRGFASMTLKRRREISAIGGRASHAAGTGHEWTTHEARAAGQKGGQMSRGGGGGRRKILLPAKPRKRRVVDEADEA